MCVVCVCVAHNYGDRTQAIPGNGHRDTPDQSCRETACQHSALAPLLRLTARERGWERGGVGGVGGVWEGSGRGVGGGGTGVGGERERGGEWEGCGMGVGGEWEEGSWRGVGEGSGRGVGEGRGVGGEWAECGRGVGGMWEGSGDRRVNTIPVMHA